MTDLAKKHCVACEGGVPPIAPEKAVELLAEVPGWELMDEAKAIIRRFAFADFAEAMVFVNRVAELAEAEEHHPDINVSWNKVSLTLSTHAIDGLSENDFILAAKINDLG